MALANYLKAPQRLTRLVDLHDRMRACADRTTDHAEYGDIDDELEHLGLSTVTG